MIILDCNSHPYYAIINRHYLESKSKLILHLALMNMKKPNLKLLQKLIDF